MVVNGLVPDQVRGAHKGLVTDAALKRPLAVWVVRPEVGCQIVLSREGASTIGNGADVELADLAADRGRNRKSGWTAGFNCRCHQRAWDAVCGVWRRCVSVCRWADG